MTPWARELAGRLDKVWLEAPSLAGNPLGDPSRRPLFVYVPPGYPEGGPYPSVYWLHGVTGSVDKWENRSSFRPNPIELFDEGIARGEIPPCILVFVDGWTSVGGAQWIDSPGTGQYATYLADDVVSWVDDHYRTIPDRTHRAIAGKSSGGYGAIVHGMLRPDVWGALACHAGDSLFETCYAPHFRDGARALRDQYGGSFANFWADFRSRPAFSKASDMTLLNDWCMAACYSADEGGTVRIPYNENGASIPEIWERWLAWDPVRMIPRHGDALRSLRGVWIDCGRRDQWGLELGAQAMRDALAKEGIDCAFELFDATHDGIEYRYPLSLTWLLSRLSR